MKETNMELYRYRNAESMLQFKEIKNQNMFFTSSFMQNDPMEGISDIVWNGDIIAWKNFFSNYCMNLTNAFIIFDMSIACEYEEGFKYIKSVKAGFVRKETRFYTMKNTSEKFIGLKVVKQVMHYLMNKDVRRNELQTLISIVHFLAIQVILEEFYHNDKDSYPLDIDKLLSSIDYDKLDSVFDYEKDNCKGEKLFQEINLFNYGLNLGIICREEMTSIDEWKKELKFLTYSYAEHYVKEISKWCLPNYFMTCFSNNYEDISMWGYYADGHKGVSLIYEFDEENPEIEVTTPPAFGIPNGEKKKLKLHKVEYAKGLIKLDFFANCLKIMQLKDELKNCWIYDSEGYISSSFQLMHDNKEQWLKNYEELVYKIASRKEEYWSHEKEFRLIHTDFWKDEFPQAGSVMKYDFSKLKGIIFGINTTENAKIEIIHTLDQVGKLNEEFNFYQSFYDYEKGTIGRRKIPIKEMLLINR